MSVSIFVSVEYCILKKQSGFYRNSTGILKGVKMCTALVFRNPEVDYLGVGFNRDESVKRGAAMEPQKYEVGELSYLSPLDSDYGGTWIGVNSNHQIYAMLNYYEANLKILRNPTSRGLLLRDFLRGETELSLLNPKNLSTFYPFRMLKISIEATDILIWNGESLSRTINSDTWSVYASSFLLGNAVEKEREEILKKNYLETGSTPIFLDLSKKFLSSHLPEKGPHSPCMHRREARTVSSTLVMIDDNKVSMYYKNSQPCENTEYKIYSLK